MASPLLAAADPIEFREVTGAAGLDEVRFKTVGTWYAAGLAFTDLDGDGWPDLYFGGTEGLSDRFCSNHRDGRFVCADAGKANLSDALAIAGGDFDGDGDLDLYVMHKSPPNALLSNDGRGHFTDVTVRTKTGGASDRYITAAGTFLDYDGDGRLDLYLGNWYASEVTPEARDQLLRQLPDGTFADVTKASGIDDQDRSTLALLALDYDRDGRQDLFLSHDFAAPMLFHNDGGGRFADVTSLQPPLFSSNLYEGMGVDSADLDGNGWPDIYVTANKFDLTHGGSALYMNQGDGTFVTRSDELGVNAGFSWGTGLYDFDRDGWTDIFVATNVADHQSVYRNIEGKSFSEGVIPGRDLGNKQCLTAAFADYDNDGRVDVILFDLTGKSPILLHNESAAANHWIRVLSRSEGRDALGARVTVTAGGRAQELEVLSQKSKGSVSDRRLFFGLGTAVRADIDVVFPGGQTLKLIDQPVDRDLVLDYAGPVEVVVAPARSAGCSMLPTQTGSNGVGLLALSWLLWRRRARSPGTTVSRVFEPFRM